jgi:ABC-2 type transport system ATP-binding protein
MVSIKNISKTYGGKTILNNVSLEIGDGQIYGLIGPSGAGKTTLVKMIVGMEKSDDGSIEVMQKRIPDLNILQSIGYMSQADSLYADLTAEENMRFFASLFKLDKKKQKERIEYTAKLVNLTEELKKKVSNYSGGMKRRLSLAVALIQDPPLLILDEPTVGIDPELRLNIWNELNRLKNEEKKTIIVTTHVMDEAEKCDCLSMVRDGKILASGSPEELMSAYNTDRLEKVFLLAGTNHNLEVQS